ncbi:hypothetical protein ANN_05008 [Periplaneta americana]|uniref:Uncharacterized protein n=1 Tax=Periplaneta americana TaxID=6978 RepID=A0ABQ8TCD5_PERAM|nr:hypothetical protein ANN_05008 [Periplaneta americana]
MSPESSTESYPVFARIGLKENPRKTQPGNLPRPGFEPGPPGFAARRPNRYSTGVDLTSDINMASLMRQLGQEIMGQAIIAPVEQSVRRLVQDAVDGIRRLPEVWRRVLHVGGDYF